MFKMVSELEPPELLPSIFLFKLFTISSRKADLNKKHLNV